MKLSELLECMDFDYEIVDSKPLMDCDELIEAPYIQLLDFQDCYLGGFTTYQFNISPFLFENIIDRLSVYLYDYFIADWQEEYEQDFVTFDEWLKYFTETTCKTEEYRTYYISVCKAVLFPQSEITDTRLQKMINKRKNTI